MENSQSILENSPLKEVEKGSLAELFQRDPLKLSSNDVQRICQELRSKRSQWALDEAKNRVKKEAKKESLSQIDMDDLLNSL